MRAGRQWIWVKATRNALTDPLGMPIDSVKAAALRATSCSLVGRTPSAINADEKNFQAVLAKPASDPDNLVRAEGSPVRRSVLPRRTKNR